jgi:hypothetical protein
LFSKDLTADEITGGFSVTFNRGFFFCTGRVVDEETIVINIDSKNGVGGVSVIRLEVYLHVYEDEETFSLLKLLEMNTEMDRENMEIRFPLNWDGDIMRAIPEEIEGDYFISIRVKKDFEQLIEK